MSNQDTRALVLIKGVVDDCSLDVVESMRQIRELAGVDATGWRDARMHNATERLRDSAPPPLDCWRGSGGRSHEARAIRDSE